MQETQDANSTPGLERSPGREMKPLQMRLPAWKSPMDRGAWQAGGHRVAKELCDWARTQRLDYSVLKARYAILPLSVRSKTGQIGFADASRWGLWREQTRRWEQWYSRERKVKQTLNHTHLSLPLCLPLSETPRTKDKAFQSTKITTCVYF